MRRRYLFVILMVGAALLLVGRATLLRGSAGAPTPTAPATASPSAPLECCQCTALGKDQDSPFLQVPGYTCADYCFQGCLERGYGQLRCKLGGVGGYAVVCPDPLPPTVTPYGQ